MPWKETNPVQERMRFVAEYLDHADLGRVNISELCRAYQISRPTGYKWLRRYREQGMEALNELPRAPRRCPHATPEHLVGLVVAARKSHPTWGPRKLRAWLRRQHPDKRLPAPSTIGGILKRYGLVKPRRRRRQATPRGPRVAQPRGPNDVWAADFKGDFKTRDGKRCYPLTITDTFSRYLIACDALPRTSTSNVRPVFEVAFREYGLPASIRTDNGAPFATVGIQGLSRLSVWWLKLGIELQRIEPGRPDQNGRHERMHRTLKSEAVRPPRANLAAQQAAFDDFQAEYNDIRPHESLGQRPPADLYERAPKAYPERVPRPTYPGHFEVRMVKNHGEVQFNGRRYFLSETLRSEPVGLVETQDGLWSVRFMSLELGQIDEREKKFHPIRGRRRKRRS